MSVRTTESTVEEAALQWLEGLGYRILHGPDISPGGTAPERTDYAEVILADRLRRALQVFNPNLPHEALEEAFRKLTRLDSPSLLRNNRTFHRWLVEGVPMEYRSNDGRIIGEQVALVDFDNPERNDWLAVNQLTIQGPQSTRRPDIIIFLNGLPVAVIELKNVADEQATIWSAYKQLQTYKEAIPALFTHNEILIISDGNEARVGSLTAGREWFLPWRTIEGDEEAPAGLTELQVVLQGLLQRERLLTYLRYFITYEDDGRNVRKILAGYHQFHAVNEGIRSTLEAAGPDGDRRAGVIWHTQGSGKSLTMAFYAGRVIAHPEMKNPTIVVITDRNDLDDQLFTTFNRCSDLLRQDPVQATDREDLRQRLKVAAGGVIFTTVQKFFPDAKGETYPRLSDRRNIIVIADEAHRSQYGFIEGFARYMREALPNASFIGFTGTPVELDDRNTRAVFGDYISIYDIEQAVRDGATVPIYYESRLVRLNLPEDKLAELDREIEEITEDEEPRAREQLKSRWAQLEAVVGTQERIDLVARDFLQHFEQRLEVMDGKAMVVCMSRRICVDLYNAIVRLRPDWHHDDDDKGVVKVVMTGSAADVPEWQPHIRSKARREALAQRFKDPDDPFKIVIVRDMWLTGFDAPCLHTMYIDKPMRGHGLMQAIARVNRVFRDKPGGLVVDYIGIAAELKKAMQTYTDSGGRGQTAIDREEAVALMVEKYEICRDMFHGFDYLRYFGASATEQLTIIREAQEHILATDGLRERFVDAVTALSKAFALAVPHETALELRDEVGFFQTVKSALVKITQSGDGSDLDREHAIRQMVSRAVAADSVMDVFALAGVNKPDISVLSDEFLNEVRALPQRNLAVEVLRKLLNDEIKYRFRTNVVQSRKFSEMLQESINKYHNRTLTTVEVITELIEMAKQLRESHQRGEDLGLTEAELAFYDALETNDSAVKVLGDEVLKKIAVELAETVRRNASIDWSIKQSVRARMRVAVKRVLRKHGYPPDKEEKATRTVIEQAERLSSVDQVG